MDLDTFFSSLWISVEIEVKGRVMRGQDAVRDEGAVAVSNSGDVSGRGEARL
jgi:hypothetical protein|tara:strand:- start:451 stop:606 length:156 start_codon:yes stop_codon:yes gene_type:complete